EWIGPNSERRHHRHAGLNRLVGGNRDHAVLQLVELLPAVEQRLERRVASASRADAQPLQLGGGDLVAHVERLRDQRRLLQLLLLDAGKRSVSRKAAAVRGGGDQQGIDLLAAERRFDQRLALLDL